jgi:glycosyltransferase involved in cell wall biosynthesis
MKNISSSNGDGPVRALFIPEWYPSKDGANQVTGTFCREHVRAAALYDDVAVLAYTSRPQRWPTLNWECIDDCGVRTFYATYGHSPIPKTTFAFFYLHLARAIRRVIREWCRPDVIHTQDSYAYFVMKAVASLGIPVVISQHSGALMRRQLDAGAVKRFRWAFARAARVLPVNARAAADYSHYGFEAPITWLPNALDTKVFYPSSKLARKPWLLHASGLTVEKRFPDIVRAFARVRAERPEAELHVAGNSSHCADLVAMANRELPIGSIRFYGRLSKPELSALMRRACGLVFPSEAETFGCVLMEAMACECPVLTTQVGGIPAVVRAGEGLFVDVGNIGQIKEGMIRLLDRAHGLDTDRISRETRERFSHETVGRILHEEHLRAATGGAGAMLLPRHCSSDPENSSAPAPLNTPESCQR